MRSPRAESRAINKASIQDRTRFVIRLALLSLLVVTFSGCFLLRGQRFKDFTTSLPIPENQMLILGFLGGRESWDNEKQAVRRLVLKLRAEGLPVQAESVENTKRKLALQLIIRAFDRNADEKLDLEERSRVRLILYGQSFGGAAVVKLARQLDRLGIPVLLTVQIDSVGRNDRWIPSNVRRAANLFQNNGFLIRGEPVIRAEDPAKTEILGNFRFDYSDRQIDISKVGFWKRVFRRAHVQMGLDPEVWNKVEALILDTVWSGEP